MKQSFSRLDAQSLRTAAFFVLLTVQERGTDMENFIAPFFLGFAQAMSSQCSSYETSIVGTRNGNVKTITKCRLFFLPFLQLLPDKLVLDSRLRVIVLFAVYGKVVKAVPRVFFYFYYVAHKNREVPFFSGR